LAPSDFHLFPTLKELLDARLFKSNEEVRDSIKQCLNGLAVVLLGEFESGAQSEPFKRSMLLQDPRTSVQD
jgi:hypothetical protein